MRQQQQLHGPGGWLREQAPAYGSQRSHSQQQPRHGTGQIDAHFLQRRGVRLFSGGHATQARNEEDGLTLVARPAHGQPMPSFMHGDHHQKHPRHVP